MGIETVQAMMREGFDNSGQSGHAARSNKLSEVLAMTRLAAPSVAVLPEQFDQNPWLLNCENGTLDLRTMELREHGQDDFCTKICPVEYDPTATCPTWEKTIAGIFGNVVVLIAFMQRLLGYVLSGDVSEQFLVILFGQGSNGKSTIVSTFAELLGADFAIKCDRKVVVAERQEGHSTERMDLFGKRFAYVSETEHDQKLKESFVKDATGGEAIRGRRMREDTWEFQPTHKLFLSTNHKPTIDGDDHAIWRRVMLIPFEVQFWNPAKGESGPDELKQDKALPEKLRSEMPGILAWAVRGLQDYHKEGLSVPEVVRAATDEYQAEQDSIKQFIAERCITGNSYRIRSGQLYSAFKCWCETSGSRLLSQTEFGTKMKKNFEHRISNGKWYLGITLQLDDLDGLDHQSH